MAYPKARIRRGRILQFFVSKENVVARAGVFSIGRGRILQFADKKKEVVGHGSAKAHISANKNNFLSP